MAPLIGRDCAQGAFMRAETSLCAKGMRPPFSRHRARHRLAVSLIFHTPRMMALRWHWGQIIVLWGDLEIWGRAQNISASFRGGAPKLESRARKRFRGRQKNRFPGRTKKSGAGENIWGINPRAPGSLKSPPPELTECAFWRGEAAEIPVLCPLQPPLDFFPLARFSGRAIFARNI